MILRRHTLEAVMNQKVMLHQRIHPGHRLLRLLLGQVVIQRVQQQRPRLLAAKRKVNGSSV